MPGGGSVKGKRPAVSHGCKTDRSTQQPNSVGSITVNYWKVLVGQGVNVSSPDLLAPDWKLRNKVWAEI